MLKNGNRPCIVLPGFLSLVRPQWIYSFVALILLLSVIPMRAEEDLDDQYLKIYNLISKADSLRDGGQAAAAKTKYEQAQNALWEFKKENPKWHAETIAFRLNYVGEKIAAFSEPASAAVQETAPKAKLADRKPAALPAGMKVTVLDPGAEPRVALRFKAKAGEKQATEMSMKIGMEMQVGPQPGQAMKMPAVNITMDTTVKDVSNDGDISYQSVMTDIAVADEPGGAPQMAEAMKATMGAFKGLVISGVMSDRGAVKTIEINVPADAAPQTRQTVDQMKDSFSSFSVPLPEEPVGPNAKWEVSQIIKSQGMSVHQTSTFQLVSLEGDRFEAKTQIAQQASNQKIQNPAMPGLKVDLNKMTGSATGSLTQDLTRVLSVSATVDSHSEISMGVDMGAQKQGMKMKIDMNIRLETK